jgi:hypothetical protein
MTVSTMAGSGSDPFEPSREQLDAWLTENCGIGLPHGEAETFEQMLHGLAYVHRQIACSRTYKVHIGQCVSAESALRMALDHFARQALTRVVQP